MLSNYQHTVTERFLSYVKIDTQSNALSNTHPSTEKQKDLSRILAKELLEIGLEDAEADEFGYVYATIPSNTSKQVPTVCFCSHIDTTSDCSGENVKPILHQNYQGQDIILPDDITQIISPLKYPYLNNFIGKDIITASGLTLLGGDDKSGVAVIMDLANYLTKHPEVKHGTLKILFTPDEEIGMGTAKLDMKKLNADFGYTLDSGELGCFEDETFSADAVTITITGVSTHPGAAKGVMINAVKVIADIVAALPKDTWSPETTEKREGFVHPLRIDGIAEKASIDFIIRSFETSELAKYEERLKAIAEKVIADYPNAVMNFEVKEQYRNMKEILDQHPQVVTNAITAFERVGLKVIKEPIRGGTDGSRLSFMGLPCPNIFTGMQAIHSKYEWIGISDMEKSVETLVELVKVWEEKSN
ncbi:MAG: peptidase T [Bacteroidetes bacterium]|nr:peptidase T [Bacteroidota bacterium]